MTGDPASISNSCFAGLIGSARVDMTPPAGIYSRNWGSAKHDIADGVHRPLFAYALVFGGDDNVPMRVILTLDLVTWCSREDEFGIRGPLLDEFDLAEDQLMMHISHNHSAPLTALDFAHKPGGDLIGAYRLFLVKQLQQCLREAIGAREQSVLSWQSGHCQLAYNRDFPDPGSGDIICGINPAKIADDRVLVGRVSTTDGAITAVLVNYACHPTTLGGTNTKISPDYPGAMRALIEEHYEGASCLFLHGASGDLAPRNGYVGNTKIADQNGRELGFAVLSALEAMLPPATQMRFDGVQSSGARLGIWKSFPHDLSEKIQAKLITVELDVKETPSVAVVKQRIADASERTIIDRLERLLMLSRFVDGRKSLPLKLWVWKIGSAFFVGTPTEMHSEFQLELRRTYPDTDLAVMNIVNGYTSYLPPSEDYETNSYQVQVSVFQAGAAEKVRAAVSAAISTMNS